MRAPTCVECRPGSAPLTAMFQARQLPWLARSQETASALSARAHVTHQLAAFCKVMATKYRILKTARQLGITIPPVVLLQATKVIE
jgi:hypothetical protein